MYICIHCNICRQFVARFPFKSLGRSIQELTYLANILTRCTSPPQCDEASLWDLDSSYTMLRLYCRTRISSQNVGNVNKKRTFHHFMPTGVTEKSLHTNQSQYVVAQLGPRIVWVMATATAVLDNNPVGCHASSVSDVTDVGCVLEGRTWIDIRGTDMDTLSSSNFIR